MKKVCSLVINLDTRVSHLEENFDHYFVDDNDDLSVEF